MELDKKQQEAELAEILQTQAELWQALKNIFYLTARGILKVLLIVMAVGVAYLYVSELLSSSFNPNLEEVKVKVSPQLTKLAENPEIKISSKDWKNVRSQKPEKKKKSVKNTGKNTKTSKLSNNTPTQIKPKKSPVVKNSQNSKNSKSLDHNLDNSYPSQDQSCYSSATEKMSKTKLREILTQQKIQEEQNSAHLFDQERELLIQIRNSALAIRDLRKTIAKLELDDMLVQVKNMPKFRPHFMTDIRELKTTTTWRNLEILNGKSRCNLERSYHKNFSRLHDRKYGASLSFRDLDYSSNYLVNYFDLHDAIGHGMLQLTYWNRDKLLNQGIFFSKNVNILAPPNNLKPIPHIRLSIFEKILPTHFSFKKYVNSNNCPKIIGIVGVGEKYDYFMGKYYLDNQSNVSQLPYLETEIIQIKPHALNKINRLSLWMDTFEFFFIDNYWK